MTSSEQLPSGPELNLLILGKTGAGKSATGNTIMDEEEVFESTGSSTSVTQVNKLFRKVVGGRSLVLVDTPGTIDTNTPDRALNEIAGAITLSPTGYDAFIVVLRYPIRVTPEEKEAVNQVERLFGENFGKYAVVIMTGGDTWRKQKRNRSKTFQQFLDEESLSTDSSSLSYFLKKFKGGCVLFDNFDEDRQQGINLIEKVDEIRARNDGRRYTNQFFDLAKKKLEEEKLSQAEAERQVGESIKQEQGDCFPKGSKVIKFPGISTDICNIIPGDHLLCGDNEGKPVYKEVYMLGHQDNDTSMQVIEIKTTSKVVKTSPGHYLPVNNGNYKLAKDICEGDLINVLDGQEESRVEPVISVSTLFATGKFNPFTFSGNLYVDGVLATCYEKHLRPEYAHPMMAIPRLVYRFNSNVLDAFNQKKFNGVPWWAYNIMKRLE